MLVKIFGTELIILSLIIEYASYFLFPGSLINICGDALNKYSSETNTYNRNERTHIFKQKKMKPMKREKRANIFIIKKSI